MVVCDCDAHTRAALGFTLDQFSSSTSALAVACVAHGILRRGIEESLGTDRGNQREGFQSHYQIMCVIKINTDHIRPGLEFSLD